MAAMRVDALLKTGDGLAAQKWLAEIGDSRLDSLNGKVDAAAIEHKEQIELYEAEKAEDARLQAEARKAEEARRLEEFKRTELAAAARLEASAAAIEASKPPRSAVAIEASKPPRSVPSTHSLC